MANANQVIVNGKTILDLRFDTVTPKTLQKGYTAHNKSGAKITGTLEVPATEERTVELSMASGNQVIQPTSGKVMSKVTVQKPATLVPGNIKKDVVIGGVTGALEAGDTSETWVIKSSATGGFATTQISFTSNGRKFTSIGANDSSGIAMVLYYDNYEAAGYDIAGGVYEFDNEAYRKLTFDTPPTGALLTWLQSNATKQTSGVSVQPSKSVSITQNGTTTVTPDTGYDALGKVDVSVDVASGEEVLNFFGGRKYYITEITPTSDTTQITITPDDTTILDSPKFLLVTQDIPAARNAVQTRTIARAPSYNYYLSAAIAFSVGQVCTQCIAYVDPYSGIDAASYVYSDVNGGDAFDGSHDITISGGSMTFNTSGDERLFKGGQTYKVLLIG